MASPLTSFLMGYDTKVDVCDHGVQAMGYKSGLWSRDVVERQMSQHERNGMCTDSPHKAEFLDRRRLMLQWWAGYLEINREGFPHRFCARQYRTLPDHQAHSTGLGTSNLLSLYITVC